MHGLIDHDIAVAMDNVCLILCDMMTATTQTVIIVYAYAEWETFHRRGMLTALSEALDPDTAILVVNRPITLDVTPWKHPQKFFSGIWRSELREDRDGRIEVLTPRLLFHDRIALHLPVGSVFNQKLLARQLRSVLQGRYPGYRKVIQWIYHPLQKWTWDAVPDCGKVYECYDEYARTASGGSDERTWKGELSLLSEADLVFAATRSLIPARAPFAKRLELLPNGVPARFFDPLRLTIDPEFERVPHPRLLYVGSMLPRVDCALLYNVMSRSPDWHLVLVGPGQNGSTIDRLRELKNVHMFGVQSYLHVPAIIRCMDIGLVPFVLNDFTRAISPLKLFEYMAVGLPVVSTQLPELSRFGDLLRTAESDPESFGKAISEVLVSDRERLGIALVARAKEYSWDQIVRKHVIPALREVFKL